MRTDPSAAGGGIVALNANFHGPWRVLSFDYPIPVRTNDGEVVMAHQLFHSFKCADPEWRRLLLDRGVDPKSAAWLGSAVGMRTESAKRRLKKREVFRVSRGWTARKAAGKMLSVLRKKARGNALFRAVLLETGDRKIVDKAADALFGVAVPANTHGKLLMVLRREIRSGVTRDAAAVLRLPAAKKRKERGT